MAEEMERPIEKRRILFDGARADEVSRIMYIEPAERAKPRLDAIERWLRRDGARLRPFRI